MDYCDGGSLKKLVEKCFLEEQHIAYIATQVLQGLAYLHANHNIHRDIKADNILLNVDASVKIADLGIAVDLDEISELLGLCGSKYWMAPEMIKFLPYDYKVDIWGFGSLMMELAEGSPPYYGHHSMWAMFMVATKGAPDLQILDKWSDNFKDFLQQCFQHHPDVRPSAIQLLQHPFITSNIINYETAIEGLKTRIANVFLGDQLESLGLL